MPPWPSFRGRIKVVSTIALHSTLNISETVRDSKWFQMTTNKKSHMGYQMVTWPMTSRDQMVTWPMTSRDPRRCCQAVRSAILATAWLLVVIYCLSGCMGRMWSDATAVSGHVRVSSENDRWRRRCLVASERTVSVAYPGDTRREDRTERDHVRPAWLGRLCH